MKWAGGGFLSTVGDLLQFGNAMLYSSQFEDKSSSQNGSKIGDKNEFIIKQNLTDPLKSGTLNPLNENFRFLLDK